MEDIVLVGFGGHALSVADSIERLGKYRIAGYTDLFEHESKYQYLGIDDNLKSIFERGIKKAAIGIGYIGKGDIRHRIYEKIKEIGFELPVIADPSAIISESAVVGEGTFIGKNVIVNAESHVGKMVIINTNAVIEHECEVGDFTHVAVSAVLCGQVRIGEAAFIGANSTIIQCREVESHIIVPAGVIVR